MKPGANPGPPARVRPVRAGGGSRGSSAAHAQTATPAPPATAPTPPLSWSAANLPPMPVYQDKYIGGGSLAPDISAGEGGIRRHRGPCAIAADRRRRERVELTRWRIREQRSRERHRRQVAMGNGRVRRVVARRCRAHGRLRSRRRRSRSRRRHHPEAARHALRRGLAGRQRPRATSTPPTSAWRDCSRASICRPVRCRVSTTEWRGPSDLQIVAGGGVPGLYDGIEVPNFRTLDGSTATAGAQWSPASHWTVGGQFIEAHDVNLAIGPSRSTAQRSCPPNTGLLTRGLGRLR